MHGVRAAARAWSCGEVGGSWRARGLCVGSLFSIALLYSFVLLVFRPGVLLQLFCNSPGGRIEGSEQNRSRFVLMSCIVAWGFWFFHWSLSGFCSCACGLRRLARAVGPRLLLFDCGPRLGHLRKNEVLSYCASAMAALCTGLTVFARGLLWYCRFKVWHTSLEADLRLNKPCG